MQIAKSLIAAVLTQLALSSVAMAQVLDIEIFRIEDDSFPIHFQQAKYGKDGLLLSNLTYLDPQGRNWPIDEHSDVVPICQKLGKRYGSPGSTSLESGARVAYVFLGYGSQARLWSPKYPQVLDSVICGNTPPRVRDEHLGPRGWR